MAAADQSTAPVGPNVLAAHQAIVNERVYLSDLLKIPGMSDWVIHMLILYDVKLNELDLPEVIKSGLRVEHREALLVGFVVGARCQSDFSRRGRLVEPSAVSLVN